MTLIDYFLATKSFDFLVLFFFTEFFKISIVTIFKCTVQRL